MAVCELLVGNCMDEDTYINTVPVP